MKFKNEAELRAFLDDKPFFHGADSYCLGNTMEEAGKIVREMLREAKFSGKAGTDNVAMDIEQSQQCGKTSEVQSFH